MLPGPTRSQTHTYAKHAGPTSLAHGLHMRMCWAMSIMQNNARGHASRRVCGTSNDDGARRDFLFGVEHNQEPGVVDVRLKLTICPHRDCMSRKAPFCGRIRTFQTQPGARVRLFISNATISTQSNFSNVETSSNGCGYFGDGENVLTLGEALRRGSLSLLHLLKDT
jgi:hypothetical protein